MRTNKSVKSLENTKYLSNGMQQAVGGLEVNSKL